MSPISGLISLVHHFSVFSYTTLALQYSSQKRMMQHQCGGQDCLHDSQRGRVPRWNKMLWFLLLATNDIRDSEFSLARAHNSLDPSSYLWMHANNKVLISLIWLICYEKHASCLLRYINDYISPWHSFELALRPCINTDVTHCSTSRKQQTKSHSKMTDKFPEDWLREMCWVFGVCGKKTQKKKKHTSIDYSEP